MTETRPAIPIGKYGYGFLIALLFFLGCQQEKTAFVEAATLYNAFEYKKELETKTIGIQQVRQKIIDSLKIQLQTKAVVLERTKAINQPTDIAAFEKLRNEYLARQTQFEEENQIMVEQYTKQIWGQLNQYIQDFGSKQGYTYIHGVNGEGNLMYANKEKDITEELIIYVNNRYNGQPK